MPSIFQYNFKVPQEAIDENGHASNVEYIRWMQEAAVLHSNTQGWTRERYDSIGSTWVVRSHTIEFLQPAFAGQSISLLTWVSNMKRIRSWRKYKFLRVEDDTVLARAETDWVFVDSQSGRPRAIPEEVAGAFEVVAGDV